MKQAITMLGLGALAVGASSCQSTESESAEIAKQATGQIAKQGKVKLGAVNHDVRIAHVSLLSDAGRSAVAVQLTGTSTRSQLGVPVLVSVTGNAGKVLYRNDTEGIETALQRMSALLPGRSEWWVDDQVLTNQSAGAVHVRVGRASASSSKALPAITSSAVHLHKQAGLSVLEGKLSNHSGDLQNKVPVFAVALKSGRVTAAGRAVVQTLPAHSSGVAFQIFLIGDPAGASVQLTVVPTAR